MISQSLRAFIAKTKPGPHPFAAAASSLTSSHRFPRTACSFTVSSNDSQSRELQTRVMQIAKHYMDDTQNPRSHRLTPTATFNSLGLDSLDSMDLIIELEERLGIDLTDADAQTRIKSLADACVVFGEYARNQTAAVSGGLSGL